MNENEEQPESPQRTAHSSPSQGIIDAKNLEEEVEHLKRELAGEKKRAAEYLNRLKYLQAELENLQKRTKREIEEITARATERLISKLLVIIDDMEVAAKASAVIDDSNVIKSGFDLILQKFRGILESEGLAKIEAVGKKLDPVVHEAGSQIVSEDAPDGIVLEELKAGYALKGKLLRPSVVVVAKNPKKPTPEEASEKER